jgi:hypothetical protein
MLTGMAPSGGRSAAGIARIVARLAGGTPWLVSFRERESVSEAAGTRQVRNSSPESRVETLRSSTYARRSFKVFDGIYNLVVAQPLYALLTNFYERKNRNVVVNGGKLVIRACSRHC